MRRRSIKRAKRNVMSMNRQWPGTDKQNLSQLMRFWYLSHGRPAKAQASLRIGAVSSELTEDEKYHNLMGWLISHPVQDIEEKKNTNTGVQRTPLTHICLVDSSILINWTSPFPILGVSGTLFSFLFCFE